MFPLKKTVTYWSYSTKHIFIFTVIMVWDGLVLFSNTEEREEEREEAEDVFGVVPSFCSCSREEGQVLWE